jgi:hypothetical protein
VSKLSIVPLTFGFSFAIIAAALSQGSVNYTGNPSNPAGDLSSSSLSLPGAGASATGPASSGKDATDDENDPSLQRLRSKDSVASGVMSRDEGELTAKTRRREKILQVESTKQLPTSGTDPKFQGSLLHSSVTSIQDIGEKANVSSNTHTSAAAEADADTDARDESDPRFRAKRFVFSPMTDEDSKKKESPRTKADSSPSPSPSSTASASPSSR